jgi:hypothetical protein
MDTRLNGEVLVERERYLGAQAARGRSWHRYERRPAVPLLGRADRTATLPCCA